MSFVAIGDIGKRIREKRETYKGVGMKQNVLANLIGVSSARLSGWERGIHDPEPMGVINLIAKHLETDSEYLLHGTRTPRVKGEESGSVKVYGSVSAGDGNTSNVDSNEIEVPIQFARDDFGALIVEGDSMLPLLHGGDIAIFRDHYHPKPGAIMACEIEGGWVVKKVVYERDRYVLKSLNPQHPDIVEAFRPTGFLVGIVRDDGPERMIRLNPYGIKD
jgi:SOS-response transcriptional repressor LexA